MMNRAALIIGLLALAAVWLTPLPRLAGQSFSAHMTMHMEVVAVASPLIALALTGGRFDPAIKAPRWFAPIPASIVELAVVWAWHAPALHHAARHTTAGLIAEQGTFLLSGLFVWLSAFGGRQKNNERDTARAAAGIVALLLTSMHMTLLGALLALTPRPLYSHAAHSAWLTPLEDQQLGGAIMLTVGGVAYLTGGLWLTTRLLHGAAAAAGEKA
jgi:putative membrane protein